MWDIVIVVLLGVSIPIAGWMGYQRGLRQRCSALAELNDQFSARAAESEHALAQWQSWEQKAVSLQDAIAGIIHEKQVWINLYTDQVIAHGNAQTCMMDAIGFLQIKLEKATGKTVRLPPIIDEARQAFLDNHVTPTLERTGIPVIHNSPPIAESSVGVQPARPEE